MRMVGIAHCYTNLICWKITFIPEVFTIYDTDTKKTFFLNIQIFKLPLKTFLKNTIKIVSAHADYWML